MRLSKWTKIGNISVDAGICWIGDPCYILHKDKPPQEIGQSWYDFCELLNLDDTDKKSWQFGHGLGVVCETGYGDGSYSVYARTTDGSDGWGKRIAEIKIVFIGDDEDD